MKNNKGLIIMRITDKIIKTALICFYAIFSLIMIFISIVCLRFPLYYLVWWKMVIASIIFGGLFFGVMLLWSNLPKNKTESNKMFILAIVLEIAFIWIMAIIHGKNHLGVGDYYILYHTAEEMAEGVELTYYNYFMTYGNNTLPMLMLSAIMKISNFIHLDIFYVLLTITTLLIILSFLSVYELTKDNYKKYRIPMIMYLMICLPVYVFASTFYTDSLSFGVGIISLALLKISIEKKAKYLIPFASILATWGICIKITSFIPLIGAAAAAFILNFSKKDKNEIKKNKTICIIIYIATIILLFGITKTIVSYNSVYRDSNEKSNPLISWIAMGMTENGSYAENYKFSDSINILSTKEEKKEMTIQYMKENISEALSLSHIVRKTQFNFASGMFSCFDYTCPDDNGSLLFRLLDPYSRLYGRSCQFTFCYIIIIYLATTYGSIRALVMLIKQKGKPVSDILSFPRIFADITFFGIIVFLMLWEANTRQLYNQLPLLIMLLFMNTGDLISSVKKRT